MANGYNINAILSITNRFTQPLNQFIQQISNIRNPIRQAQQSTQQFANNTQTAFNNASSSASNLGSSMSNMASKIKGALATIGVGKLGADVIQTTATFEQSMSKVKALSGASGEQFKQLEAKAREMGAKTCKSAKDSADALGYMALAGWDTDQMLEGIEPILKGSVAGCMDLARCSDLVTDSMSAMGIKTEDLGHYMDVCTKTQASSNTSLSDLLEAYNGCGGTLKNMNVSMEESATILGVLANRHKKGSEAGNALNSILVNLMGTTKTSREALAQLGVSMYNADGTNKGLTATLRELSTALSGCTQEQRDMLEAQLGGKTQMDTLQALLSGVSEEYDTLREKLDNSKGSLEEQYNIMNDNLIGSWETFKSAMEEAKIAIGTEVLDSLRNFIDWVTSKVPSATDYITNKIEYFKGVFASLSAFFVAHKDIIIPVVAGIVSAFVSFKTITKTVSTVQKTISGLSKAFGFLTSPLGIIIVAIGLLVAGFIYAYTHSETFREKVNAVVEVVKEKIQSFVTKVCSCIEAVKGWLQEHQGFVQGVKDYIMAIIETAIQFVQDAITALGEIFGGIVDVISGIIDIITGIFEGDWNKVWEGCKEIVKGVIEQIKGLWDGLVAMLKQPVNFVVNLFKKDQSGEVPLEDGTANKEVKEEAGENAKGTNNWRGGWTWVNEEGGELMNLPNGTQIIPHDLSEAMVKEHARNVGNGMNVNIPKLAEQIIVREDADIDKIGESIANKLNIARMRFN